MSTNGSRTLLALVALALASCTPPTTTAPTQGEPDAPHSAASEPSGPSAASKPLSTTTPPSAAPAPTAAKAPPRDVMHVPSPEERAKYGWLATEVAIRPLRHVMPPPTGFRRIELEPGSFGAWLRELPLRAEGTPVNTYDGRLLRSASHPRVAAVAELDVGKRDLQQCADSVIRLHAEWMWSQGRASEIGYHFLSGDYATWSRHAAGDRPAVDGARVVWSRSAKPSAGHDAFRRYLDLVFNYASTISLAQRRKKVERTEAAPGDFFILPGGPGHAVLILDVAVSNDGRRVALLGQGFMPAQDFHVLRASAKSAWFSLDEDTVDTPFWVPFPWTALRRM